MQLSRSEASLTRAPGAAGAAPEPRALNAGVRVGRAGGPVRSGVGEEKHEEASGLGCCVQEMWDVWVEIVFYAL